MSPSDPPFHLWIAADDTRTVAALAPLKMSRTPLKHEWGSITDLRAVPVPPKSPNIAGIIVLATLVLIGAVGLCLSGAPFLVIFILAALALAIGLAATTSKAPAARVVAPDQEAFPALHHTLGEDEEREDFFDLVESAERAGRALPAVEEVIDPAEGGQLLAQVLWEAADVLSRRQQLRPQVVRQQQRTPTASPSSHAAQALAEQREKVTALWDQTEAELARIRTALELAAVAAENAAHDPDAIDAVREAYRELADVYGERF
ncbi:hypothetical protein ONA91_25790 [Micromonospora sp. DR5-3]|uniref:hypothetical protein n=1 Tax=unclassified Micromonospora TaxID=2617518 RepID=UPI0011D4082E|nr:MULTISPECIES: hypothetical protein [unclassified Micromonospora]MCW3817866.1 hypothetical protein [Micromonospora sp. DR5-3]TYC22969.1 hypothetical protein FXF52_18095 [Micromonospora sp. MP36]